ncbi:alpha/beta fold hydrolase [Halobacillus sp. BBL2006]|uniref:alpha/beta fold hydrolase n=1 Tax=Halobacillus sp. BBL2006 TaxID=1543706 RepID=UPI000691B0BE|nr:alpha/beta hydrolase [Halobacillus sp. BBL2006]
MMPFTEIKPSFSLYYKSVGTGFPIVFIHPPHMGHHVFKYQQKLSSHYQIITYDLRGHGSSGNCDESPIISAHSNDLALFLDKIGIEKAIITGYSAGGTIAQDFTLRYPDKVKALVLAGGFSEVSTGLLRTQFHLGMKLVQNGKSELLSSLLAKTHKITDEDQTLLFQDCVQADPQTAFQFYEKSMEYRCTDDLGRIHCPVLLLYGQFSHIRSYVKLYEDNIPQMKSVLVSRALHQLPIREHRAFNHALMNFLQGV